MITPHGGRLTSRVLEDSEVARILSESSEFPKIPIDTQCGKIIKNLSFGVYSPLEGFMTNNDLLNVLKSGRLENDLPWTIPIVLDVEEKQIQNLRLGDQVILFNESKNGEFPVALMNIEEIYKYDKKEFTLRVYSTLDPSHVGVSKVKSMKEYLIGGKINLLKKAPSPFPKNALQPKETRALFKTKGWQSIVAFQTRNPPHMGHEHIQKTALGAIDGLFISPVIGQKKIGDFSDDVIIEAYKVLLENYYRRDNTILNIFETEMHYAGPKEAIFHAIARKNFGCTHIIIGRDHAGLNNFYPPYAAHEIFEEYPDLGIQPFFIKSVYRCKKCNAIVNEKICPHGSEYHVHFSGTNVRAMFAGGTRPPPDLMRPEVVDVILNHPHPFVERINNL